jgi:mono/diheme cytochrome c family protein
MSARHWIGALVVAAAFGSGAHPAIGGQAGDASKGKTVFEQNCAVCHGISGDLRGVNTKGMDPVPSNFSDPAFWKGKTDASLFGTIRDGSSREMPGYRDLLTPSEIRDVIVYIKTFRKS